jgi:hypothetical protein
MFFPVKFPAIILLNIDRSIAESRSLSINIKINKDC